MDKTTQHIVSLAVCTVGLGLLVIGPIVTNVHMIVSGTIVCIISLVMMWLVTKD